MRFTKKKIAAVVATTAVIALGAGIAVAYWTSTGDGVDEGTTSTSSEFVVTSVGPTGASLLPGVGTQTFAVTILNPSDAGHQKLNALTVAVALPDTDADGIGEEWLSVAGCSADDYTVSITTPPLFTDMTPGTTRTATATLAMVNSLTNQDGCKLAAVPLYFHAS